MAKDKYDPVRRLRLPEGIWRKARAAAIMEGKNLGQWWTEAGEQKLGKKETKGR